jgi:hypothetical protein
MHLLDRYRTEWIAGSCIAALVLFAFFTLGERSVAADEFSMYWAARLQPSQILKLYFSSHENNPAAPALVQHYWGAAFGYSDAPLRILSLLFALGGLWFLWNIVRVYGEDYTYSPEAQLRVFVIAASTPFVWMSATFARYQPMVLCLGLAALYWYLLWFRSKSRKHLVLYVVCTALTFYVHYLSAAVFALCAGLHYLFSMRVSSRMTPQSRTKAEILQWVVSQVAIILLILPVVFLIASTYSQMDLSASLPIATNKSKAVLLFLAATMLGIVNGFVVAPWTVWVVVPMIVATLCLLVIGIREKASLRSRDALWFLAAPLVIMSLVVVRMYPPLTIYLIPSVQRVGFLAPIAWVFLGFALVAVRRLWLQTTLLVVILLCNLYAIATWNLNVVAVQHTPPLREVVRFMDKSLDGALSRSVSSPNDLQDTTRESASVLLAHSVGYRYGMESVGSNSPGSEDAFQRYLPHVRTVFWWETDIWRLATSDECLALVSRGSSADSNRTVFVRDVFVLQRNRYPQNAQILARTLTANGYTLQREIPLQRQTAFDVWFKAQLVKFPIAGVKDDAAPQEYIYTLKHFRHTIQQ